MSEKVPSGTKKTEKLPVDQASVDAAYTAWEEARKEFQRLSSEGADEASIDSARKAAQSRFAVLGNMSKRLKAQVRETATGDEQREEVREEASQEQLEVPQETPIVEDAQNEMSPEKAAEIVRSLDVTDDDVRAQDEQETSDWLKDEGLTGVEGLTGKELLQKYHDAQLAVNALKRGRRVPVARMNAAKARLDVAQQALQEWNQARGSATVESGSVDFNTATEQAFAAGERYNELAEELRQIDQWKGEHDIHLGDPDAVTPRETQLRKELAEAQTSAAEARQRAEEIRSGKKGKNATPRKRKSLGASSEAPLDGRPEDVEDQSKLAAEPGALAAERDEEQRRVHAGELLRGQGLVTEAQDESNAAAGDTGSSPEQAQTEQAEQQERQEQPEQPESAAGTENDLKEEPAPLGMFAELGDKLRFGVQSRWLSGAAREVTRLEGILRQKEAALAEFTGEFHEGGDQLEIIRQRHKLPDRTAMWKTKDEAEFERRKQRMTQEVEQARLEVSRAQERKDTLEQSAIKILDRAGRRADTILAPHRAKLDAVEKSLADAHGRLDEAKVQCGIIEKDILAITELKDTLPRGVVRDTIARLEAKRSQYLTDIRFEERQIKEFDQKKDRLAARIKERDDAVTQMKTVYEQARTGAAAAETAGMGAEKGASAEKQKAEAADAAEFMRVWNERFGQTQPLDRGTIESLLSNQPTYREVEDAARLRLGWNRSFVSKVPPFSWLWKMRTNRRLRAMRRDILKS